MLMVAAMLTNMMAETMCASVAASSGLVRRSRRNTARDRLLGLHGEGESVAVVRLFGVAEDDLPQVGASVVDLDAVALHDRADDRHHRVERVGNALGGRPALLQGVDVAGVLHEQEQLALGLGIQEQGARADVGLVGDLLGRDLVDAMLREELAGRGGDAVQLVLLVPLAPSDRLWARAMTVSSGNRL